MRADQTLDSSACDMQRLHCGQRNQPSRALVDMSNPCEMQSRNTVNQSLDLSKLSLVQLEQLTLEIMQSIERQLAILMAEIARAAPPAPQDTTTGANGTAGTDTGSTGTGSTGSTGSTDGSAGSGSSGGADTGSSGSPTSSGDIQTGRGGTDQPAPQQPSDTGNTSAKGSLADALAQNDFSRRGLVTADAPFHGPNGGAYGKVGDNGPKDITKGVYSVGPWGVIYNEQGKTIDPNAKVEVKDSETYFHRKSGGWVKAQDSSQDHWWEANYKKDFSGDVHTGPGGKIKADGSYEFGAAPANMNDHFGPGTPATKFDSNLYDGVYTTMSAKTDMPNSGMVMQIGIDHYDYKVHDYSPAFGANNWTRLTTDWQPLYYTSLESQTFKNDPPPGLKVAGPDSPGNQPDTGKSSQTGTDGGSTGIKTGGASSDFGPQPSWSNDNEIKNNNGGLVAPAFYTQTIGDHATYLPANIKQPVTGFDEGEMIDERGMKQADLTAIPMYGTDDSNWLGNVSNGKYLGSIEVPKDLQILRQPTTYNDGSQTNGNSTVTIITPDGKEMNFAKTYIGPDKSLSLHGNVLIGAPVGHGAGWMGNEGEITTAEMIAAAKSQTAPDHALGLTVPYNILNNSNHGVTGPALYADSNYAKEYSSPNTHLKAGSHLAVPKGVTAQDLGLETNLGKALLQTMEQFGAYVDDTTGPKAGILPEAQYGAAEAVGLPENNSSNFQRTTFSKDFAKILAAAEVVD